MMKNSHPKIKAQRALLYQQLNVQEQLISEDIQALKEAAKPIEIAKNVIHQAAESFSDNSLATQGMRLAMTIFPRRSRHPIFGIAAQIAVPLLVRNMPDIWNFVARKTEDLKQTPLGEKLGNIWDQLRSKITKKRLNSGH